MIKKIKQTLNKLFYIIIYGKFAMIEYIIKSNKIKEIFIILIALNISLIGLLIKSYKSPRWKINQDNHQNFRQCDLEIDKNLNLNKLPRFYGVIIKYDLLDYDYYLKHNYRYTIIFWNSVAHLGMVGNEFTKYLRYIDITINDKDCIEIIDNLKDNQFNVLNNNDIMQKCYKIHKFFFNTYQNTINADNIYLQQTQGSYYDQKLIKLYVNCNDKLCNQNLANIIKNNFDNYNFSSFIK